MNGYTNVVLLKPFSACATQSIIARESPLTNFLGALIVRYTKSSVYVASCGLPPGVVVSVDINLAISDVSSPIILLSELLHIVSIIVKGLSKYSLKQVNISI